MTIGPDDITDHVLINFLLIANLIFHSQLPEKKLIIHLTRYIIPASFNEGMRFFWHTLCITLCEERSS